MFIHDPLKIARFFKSLEEMKSGKAFFIDFKKG